MDVEVRGSGFVSGSNARWLLNGVADPRVKTNSTRFVSSSSLIANITIAAGAVPSQYDIEVATPAGKKSYAWGVTNDGPSSVVVGQQIRQSQWRAVVWKP
jgi:hypothetical protein